MIQIDKILERIKKNFISILKEDRPNRISERYKRIIKIYIRNLKRKEKGTKTS